MTRRNQTKEDTPDLTDQQETALRAIVSGQTCAAAAAAAGVTRQTVSGWMNHDVEFIRAVRLRRKELWAAHIDRARSLVFDALSVFEDDLAGDDLEARRAAARFIVKSFSADLGRELEPIDNTGRDSILLETLY